jgi:hypothetical protein
MSQASRGLAKPDAAKRIAEEVLSVASADGSSDEQRAASD